jgi:hypothetical protein
MLPRSRRTSAVEDLRAVGVHFERKLRDKVCVPDFK